MFPCDGGSHDEESSVSQDQNYHRSDEGPDEVCFRIQETTEAMDETNEHAHVS